MRASPSGFLDASGILDGVIDFQQQNVLSAIRELEHEQGRLDEKRRSLIAAARHYGASWQLIAQALGTSKQAAWERFGSLEPQPIDQAIEEA